MCLVFIVWIFIGVLGSVLSRFGRCVLICFCSCLYWVSSVLVLVYWKLWLVCMLCSIFCCELWMWLFFMIVVICVCSVFMCCLVRVWICIGVSVDVVFCMMFCVY